jgi:hypothetical protein
MRQSGRIVGVIVWRSREWLWGYGVEGEEEKREECERED